MKSRALPTLLLLGLLIFGLTQSVAGPVVNAQGQAAAQVNLVSQLSQPAPIPTASQEPTATTKAAQTTPTPTVSISETTLPATANPVIFSAKVETAVANIMSTTANTFMVVDAVSQQAVALAAQYSNAAETQPDPSIGTVPVLVDQLTRLDSVSDAFDLSKLQLKNLAQIPSVQTASAPESGDAATVAAKVASTSTSNASGFYTGASGIIPDATAKQLAEEPLAPKLWPVRGPITSVFGVRPVLNVPSTGNSTSGKGGAGPTVSTNTAASASQPTPTPTASATTHPAVTATPTITPTATPTSTPTATTAPLTTTPAATATVPPATTPAAPTQPIQGFTPAPVEVIQTPAIQLPTTTPEATSPTPTATTGPEPTATPTISPTTTISPTVSPTPTPTPTPTATPFPSGPVPLINGGLGAVGPGEEFHTGYDIAVPSGTQVHATADGTVLYAGPGGGYGNVVFIQHPGGFVTVYGHNSRLLVTAGQSVKAGQTISLSGSTGYSTGPHVHYEVRYQGKIANPVYFLK